jgi:Na+-driven multidrug efflux pump
MLLRRQADETESPAVARGSTLRAMLRLAAPTLGEQLLLMLVQISDTVLTGRRLSPLHLAAMSQIAYVMWLLTNLFVAIDSGATALIARFIGAGDRETACRVTNQAFLLGVGLATIRWWRLWVCLRSPRCWRRVTCAFFCRCCR